MSAPPFAAIELSLPARMILVGVFCSVPCALLGCFLVLRRMSLLGDAISHAVLPGIVLACLLTGQVTGLPIVLGAMAVGVLTAFLTELIRKIGNVSEDASMGVVFTSLFALGVVLLPLAPRGADLDPGCVLYGRFEFTAVDRVGFLGVEIPAVLLTLVPTLLLTLAFLGLLWKELKIGSFDAGLATAMGLNATLIHYLLMGMVAAVTVASFEAVGAILVVAMLIVPAATAQLLTDRLSRMLLWAAAVAVLSSVLGWWLSSEGVLNSQMSATMAVAAGGLFLLAVLFAPRHGVLAKVVRNWQLGVRILSDDVVALLYRGEERGEAAAGRAEVARAAPGWLGRVAVALLRGRGEVEPTGQGALRLTEAGRRRGESLVRAHRLWETYLDREFALPPDHLHEPAERMEHYVGRELQEELAEELHRPEVDPHGKPIPPQHG
jgi:manganese/zinc/iron transport system permease protein